MIRVCFKVTFLVSNQPVDGRGEELTGRIGFQYTGGEKVGIGNTVLVGSLNVYPFRITFIHIHRINNCMQQVTPSDRLFSFKLVIDKGKTCLPKLYDMAAESFQTNFVPAVFRGIF